MMFRDDDGDRLLTTREVAKWLRVDVTTVRRWIKKGLLEAVALPHEQQRKEYRVTRRAIKKLFPEI